MGDPVTLGVAALIAGTTAQVGSGVLEAAGEARADSFRASEANAAARRGKIAASETDVALREELRSVLGNIRAVAASAGRSPDSPTTLAILENETRISDRQRRITVSNIEEQVSSDKRSAAFLTTSARDKFIYGSLGSVGRGFSTLAKASG